MTHSAIRAITFDLWDTIFIDDSDEPKRAAQGLRSKQMERCALVQEFLERHQPVSRELVEVAYATANAAFHQTWYAQNVTWTVRERLSVLLKGLGRELPESELEQLVRLHEEMEVAVQPDLAPGIQDVLSNLEGKYLMAVISDAIFTPGRALRQILASYGISQYFDAFVFSDEIGCAKPSSLVFEAAAKSLGVSLSEIVHIGDRELKDVKGPHTVGARAILCTVVKDRGSQSTAAHAVCSSFSDLPAILDDLNQH
jgi:HAD superfamily hydrolase (TIGR01549 family)